MKSKEKGWVSNLLNWGRERQMSAQERLYGAAIEIARRPDLFAKYGVNDDVDGRFDALALVVSMVMRRLKELGDDGRDLSQQLFDLDVCRHGSLASGNGGRRSRRLKTCSGHG